MKPGNVSVVAHYGDIIGSWSIAMSKTSGPGFIAPIATPAGDTDISAGTMISGTGCGYGGSLSTFDTVMGDKIYGLAWGHACAQNTIVTTGSGGSIELSWPVAGRTDGLSDVAESDKESHTYVMSGKDAGNVTSKNTAYLICDGTAVVASVKHGQYNAGWNDAVKAVKPQVKNNHPVVTVPKKYEGESDASGTEDIPIGCVLAQGSAAGTITAKYGPSYGGTAHTCSLTEKSISVTSSQEVRSNNNKQSRTKIVVSISGVTSQTYYSDWYSNYNAGYSAGYTSGKADGIAAGHNTSHNVHATINSNGLQLIEDGQRVYINTGITSESLYKTSDKTYYT